VTPEAQARQSIDQRLAQAGWIVQDHKALNLGAGVGVAVREYHTATGPADYVLFVERQPVGVIEAKKEETILTFQEDQTLRYSLSALKWQVNAQPLPFLYESTGKVTRFTDGRDPAPRSREVFSFHRPETLKAWQRQPQSLRRRLAEHLPPLPSSGLRDCQIAAVTGLETSLAANRPRALIQMATGAGKTFTAITAVYRLLKFAGAKRILFLVDTRNLGKQAEQEFRAYTPPDDPRKFVELYNVQRLASPAVDPHAQVCISTIQRMYSILSGDPIDESAEDVSLNELRQADAQAKFVQYNPAVPVETFDFIVIDECHRSIYNLWKQVLDYFDAFLIGLTATPDQRTFGFFNENVVAEYSYEDSVADGVNVPYDVYLIETQRTRTGGVLPAAEWVDHRDRLSRARRWAQVDEDTAYTGKELDRSVVNVSQIRQVIQAMKTAVESTIYPRRKEVPKTLIFAKTDSHADDIIQVVREVYGQGNAFCKKVTYTADDPEGTLSDFRIEYNPRIAVTVDMIATGTDVKPLEVLLFMRDVRSRSYYQQMKGRGVRSLGHEDLHRVSESADSAKTHFVLIDAVGVEASLKTDSRPLERKPTLPLADLLQGVAVGHRDDDTVLSLANRLVRLARQLDDKALARIAGEADGVPLACLARGLLAALDPDKIVAAAIANAKAAGITRDEATLTEQELQAVRAERVAAACLPFDNPQLRERIDGARREREQLIDHVNLDQVTFTGYSADAQAHAKKTIEAFKATIAAHKDDIEALRFIYQQPYQRRAMTFAMIEQLHEQLARPPLMLTTERLWSAYERVRQSQVKGVGLQRQLTDLIALVRFALGFDAELRPFAEGVSARFQSWIFRHNAQRATAFTPEQTEWLRLMKDHIAASVAVERSDFDHPPFAGKGGLQKAWGVFGGELDGLMKEMNEELVA